MNLVERFNQFLWRKDAAEVAANEAMILAIEYKWWSVTQPTRIFDIRELPEGMDIEPFLKLKEQEHFNKFITEFYGKIEGQV